jgi:hypothetical protein
MARGPKTSATMRSTVDFTSGRSSILNAKEELFGRPTTSSLPLSEMATALARSVPRAGKLLMSSETILRHKR